MSLRGVFAGGNPNVTKINSVQPVRGASRLKRVLQAAASAYALALCGATAPALASSIQVQAQAEFDIPAQPLRDALEYFTVQSGVLLAAQDSLLEGRRSSAVDGRQNVEQALTARWRAPA